jgi:hypothetical protein
LVGLERLLSEGKGVVGAFGSVRENVGGGVVAGRYPGCVKLCCSKKRFCRPHLFLGVLGMGSPRGSTLTYELTFDSLAQICLPCQELDLCTVQLDDPRPSSILDYSKIHDNHRIDLKASELDGGQKMTPCFRADPGKNGATSLQIGTWLALARSLLVWSTAREGQPCPARFCICKALPYALFFAA